MGETGSIDIEVAFALPADQVLMKLTVPAGTTAAEAVTRSGLAERFPDQTIEGADLSIFSRLVDGDEVLRSGDRVEILRPLKADPKEVRRALAAQGKTMGKRRRAPDQVQPPSSMTETESPSKKTTT